LNVVVHPADVQDRDGAFYLLRRARRLFPFIKRIFADGGYAGEKMALVVWRTGTWKLEIVKRPDAIGFEVLSKRWIVERTFAWISRNRRLARDFERYAITVAAFVRLAMIRIMLRRLPAPVSAMIRISKTVLLPVGPMTLRSSPLAQEHKAEASAKPRSGNAEVSTMY